MGTNRSFLLHFHGFWRSNTDRDEILSGLSPRAQARIVHRGFAAQAYDLLKTVGGLNNEEMTKAFLEWNKVSQCLLTFHLSNRGSMSSYRLQNHPVIILSFNNQSMLPKNYSFPTVTLMNLYSV